MRFHINREDGNVGVCSATKGKCPYGSPAEHFDSLVSAAQAYEAEMADNTIPSTRKEVDAALIPVYEPSDDELAEQAKIHEEFERKLEKLRENGGVWDSYTEEESPGFSDKIGRRATVSIDAGLFDSDFSELEGVKGLEVLDYNGRSYIVRGPNGEPVKIPEEFIDRLESRSFIPTDSTPPF